MKYEALTLLRPENTEEQVDEIIEKIKKNIEVSKGNFLDAEKWGKRELNFTFQKHKNVTEAYYVLVSFEKESGDLKKLDYSLKIDDNIVRHMISKKGK